MMQAQRFGEFHCRKDVIRNLRKQFICNGGTTFRRVTLYKRCDNKTLKKNSNLVQAQLFGEYHCRNDVIIKPSKRIHICKVDTSFGRLPLSLRCNNKTLTKNSNMMQANYFGQCLCRKNVIIKTKKSITFSYRHNALESPTDEKM